MTVLSNLEQANLDGLWQMENRYFAQFDNVSLPLGGFNHNDFMELYFLAREQLEKSGRIDAIKIVDVGCWTGMSSLVLAMIADKYKGFVTAVDWFRGSEKTNLDFAGKYFNIKKVFEDNIAQWDQYKKRINLIEATSGDASKQIDDESQDLIFIDADHRYMYIKKDIEVWLRKLRKGGILCGHDCEIILSKGLETMDEIFRHEDKAEVIHWGVCRAVTELGGKKYREMNINAPHESLKSGIWYYVKP